jgi:hypothetical protein
MAKKKKSAKKAKRRVCEVKGCRKTALEDGGQCRVCMGNNDPQEMVVKSTELEALRWSKFDTELRNDQQAMQILRYKYNEVKNKAEQEMAWLQAQQQQLEASITARKPEYLALVAALAEKYGIKDPGKMTIDPDTLVIRDLSKM